MVRADFYRTVLGILPVAQGLSGLTFTHAGQAESNDGTADALDVKGENFVARLFVDSKTHLPLMLTYMAPQPRVHAPPRRHARDDPQALRGRIARSRRSWSKTPSISRITRR